MKFIKRKRCKECNSKTYSKKIWKTIDFAFLHTFAIIGGIFFSLSLIFFIFGAYNLPVEFINKGIGFMFTQYSTSYSNDVRSLAINLTSECWGNEVYCHAKQLYIATQNTRYVPSEGQGKMYEPLYVYNNGGDCKNTAGMFVAFMQSLGFKAWVECSINFNHCVAVIPDKKASHKDYDEIIIVDLTTPSFKVENKDYDIWSDY